MAKFHVNTDGNAGECEATVGDCPFGGPTQHYATPEIARKAFELSLAGSTLPSPAVKNESYLTDLVPVDKRESAFIEDYLKNKGAGMLSVGDMISLSSGKPKMVSLEFDVTAPEGSGIEYGRSAPMKNFYDKDEALENIAELKESGLREISYKEKSVSAPIFDEHDAKAAQQGRERLNILRARQAALNDVQTALNASENKEQAFDLLINSSNVYRKPKGNAIDDEVQSWQARTNTIGEFIQYSNVFASEPSEDHARWCLTNMRPVQYYYK